MSHSPECYIHKDLTSQCPKTDSMTLNIYWSATCDPINRGLRKKTSNITSKASWGTRLLIFSKLWKSTQKPRSQMSSPNFDKNLPARILKKSPNTRGTNWYTTLTKKRSQNFSRFWKCIWGQSLRIRWKVSVWKIIHINQALTVHGKKSWCISWRNQRRLTTTVPIPAIHSITHTDDANQWKNVSPQQPTTRHTEQRSHRLSSQTERILPLVWEKKDTRS